MSQAYTMAALAAYCGAKISGDGNRLVRYLCTDSRRISFPEESLFIALTGEQRDGHAYISDVYKLGVTCFLVERIPDDCDSLTNATFLEVPGTLIALQAIAAAHRGKFRCPVIGITGSNGKTIVKEWLNQLLGAQYHIVRSPRSYNSQIGVPLSVWQLTDRDELAIFEAGISKPGEMQALARIIQPTLGILTNIGAAHDDGFGSRLEKWQEKSRLFVHADWVLVRQKDMVAYGRPPALAAGTQLCTWGAETGADILVENADRQASQTIVKVQYAARQYHFSIPVTEDAGYENAIICICLALKLGFTEPAIQARLPMLHAVEMRLELKKGIHQSTIINDSYSNDLSSLAIALDYLDQQAGEHRTLIISDLQLPHSSIASETYEQVLSLIAAHRVQRIITVGSGMQSVGPALLGMGRQVLHFPSTADLLADLAQLNFDHDTILVKGSRDMMLEKVVEKLAFQSHQTQLEINLSALAANLAWYREHLEAGTRLMVMVKAFGYGSGDAEVARILQFSKVDYLAVAYTDEGVALRQAGVALPVMVLNAEPASFGAMERFNLEPEIFSFDMLEAFAGYCRSNGIQAYPVHLKLDTGMHRLGFEPAEAEALGQLLKTTAELQVKSVFTHLVASEDAAEDDFTRQQVMTFERCCSVLKKHIGDHFMMHAANTAGITRHPFAHFNMVRLGVGLYGGTDGTQTVMRLHSTVAQVKKVAAGETVGYGRKARLERPSIIATVRIGYADGYSRQLGNGVGHMWIRGAMAPVVGNVCMDMTMLDVTDIPGVLPGDAVEVFGDHISMQMLARWCGTIAYEIMTGISHRVRRVYTHG